MTTKHAMSDPALAAARYAWDEGHRRLAPLLGAGGARVAIVDAVHERLRRTVGATFRLRELVDAYDTASDWYLDLAARHAPREPQVWDPAVTLDGAFALYQRHATDWRG